MFRNLSAAFVLPVVLSLACTVVAHGDVITLSGGDAGEGLVINPATTVYAVDFYANQAHRHERGPRSHLSKRLLQRQQYWHGLQRQRGGHDFHRRAPGCRPRRVNGGGGNAPAANFPIVTSNDTNLESILTSIYYGVQHVSISGLNPNQVYTIQALVSDGTYNARSLDFAVNGVVKDTNVVVPTSTGLNIKESATASSSGVITLDLTPNVGSVDHNPTLAGLVVSSPEPSAFILCGLGAGGLLVAVRRRRRA